MRAGDALWAWWGPLLPPGLKGGWRVGPGTQRRSCAGTGGSRGPWWRNSAAAQLAKGSQGTDLPQLPPSHLAIPCQCRPPTMAKPNRKLEGKGSLLPEMPAFQGKTESGCEGQQEFPTVRRGVGKILNNLKSRGPHRTEHRPVRGAAMMCLSKSHSGLHSRGSLEKVCARLQGNPCRHAHSVSVLAAPVGTAVTSAVAQTSSPATGCDPVTQTYGRRRRTVKCPLPKARV